MRNQLKTWIISLLVITLIAVLSACGKTNETTSDKETPVANETTSDKETPVAADLETTELELVGVRDAQISSQQIIADKLGYFEEEGLKVTNKLIESGPDIGPMVAGGSAPISFQTNFMDIILSSNNVGVKIVAPLAQIAGTQAVVLGKDVKLNSAKDLEGMTLGIPSGADVMIAIENMGTELGVDISKIKKVNLSPSDAITALQKGDVDLIAAWEPFITKGISNGGTFLLSGTKSNLPEKQGDVEWMSVHTTLQVTDDFLKKNPNTIKAVLRGLKKATDYINDNREEAIKILAPELHLEIEELTSIMNRNVYTMEVGDTYVNGSNGEGVGQYLLEVGNITNIPKFSLYHDLSLLKEAAPELITTDFD